MQIKVGDAVDFVMHHPNRRNAFPRMDEAAVANAIDFYGQDGGLAWCAEDGCVTGLALLEVNREYQILTVHEMLTATPQATLELCCIFDANFRGYDIQASRDGSGQVTVRYKRTARMIQLLARLAASRQQTFNLIGA
jgi:hypothetical protein